MIKVVFYFLALCLLLSCSSNNCSLENHNSESITSIDSFKYNDLTIHYLKNWTLIENVDEDKSKMLIWEREGLESSGQFFVTITESNLELDFVLNVMKSNLFNNIPIDKSIIKESDIKRIKYLNVDALDQNYQYEYKGSMVFGRFLVFKIKSMTYVLLFQTDESDRELNKKGFDFFEKKLIINTR